MKRRPSIRKKISTFALAGLVGLVLFFVAAVIANGLWQQHQQVEKLEVEMLATAKGQAQRILGTMLLPEEREALPLILDQIKKQEGLLAISVNQFGHNQVQTNLGCRIISDGDSICSDSLDDQVQTLSKLQHGDRVFGELAKTKMLPKLSWMSLAGPQLWVLIFAAFTMAAMMLMVLRFIQQDLCDSVQEIVAGLEQGQESRRQLINKQSYRELRHLARALYGLQSQVEQKSVKESLGEMAKQVAHDLRSPLSLLNVVTAASDHPITTAEKRLAAQAVKRLEQVAESLLKSDQADSQSFNTNELGRMIENLIAEKSYSHQGQVEFIFDNRITSPIELNSKPESISRTLSNLIDNAIEALEGQTNPSIRLSLTTDADNDVLLDILDTGVGLDETNLPTVSAKKFGHAMGVRAAKRDLVAQNGALAYNSLVGAGTATRIRLA